MTCVRFYLGTSGSPAKSYAELHTRLRYLDQAKTHLESLLKERAVVKSSFVSHVGPAFLGDDKKHQTPIQEVSTTELKNHLNTVDLQIKVTDFFYNRGRSHAQETGKGQPTLFGHGKERAELVVKVSFSYDIYVT